MHDFQEILVNIVASPLPHKEPMLDLLPWMSESVLSRYRSLSTSQVTHSLTSLVQGSIVPNLDQPSNPVTIVENPSSSAGSPISHSSRDKPLTKLTLVVSGVTSSTR